MRLSLDTYFNPSSIYDLYVLFLEISHQARFCLQISHPTILFIINAKGIFKLWEFYCSHSFAGNTQSVHIVSFPAGRARSCHSSGHPTKKKIKKNKW